MRDHRPESVAYVELDALWDTRLGTIAQIDPAAAIKCLQDPRYYNRQTDDFTDICGIDRETFQVAYAKRDEETLRASMLTEIPFIVNTLAHQLEQETIDTPFISRVRVELNVWPYQLEPETLDAIAAAVTARCGQETYVSCVSIEPKDLTPTLIRSRYSGLIMYNFREWLGENLTLLEKVKFPRVTVLAPALFHDKIPDEREFLKEGIAEGITALQLTELATVELFALSLLPIRAYSILQLPGVVQQDEAPQEEPVVLTPRTYKEL